MKTFFKTLDELFKHTVLLAAFVVLTLTTFDNPYRNQDIFVWGYPVSTHFITMCFYVLFNALFAIHLADKFKSINK